MSEEEHPTTAVIKKRNYNNFKKNKIFYMVGRQHLVIKTAVVAALAVMKDHY